MASFPKVYKFKRFVNGPTYHVKYISEVDPKYNGDTQVRLAWRFRFRVWLGLRIMKLGAFVTGVGFEIHDENDD